MGQILSKKDSKISYTKMNECVLCKSFFTKTMGETLCPSCKKTVVCESPLSNSVFLLSTHTDSESE